MKKSRLAILAVAVVLNSCTVTVPSNPNSDNISGTPSVIGVSNGTVNSDTCSLSEMVSSSNPSLNSVSTGTTTGNSISTSQSVGDGNIDFYVINDLHGSLENNNSTYELGITRMATFFKQRRALNPEGTVILANGDNFQGSADSNLTRGKLVTEAFNLMGFSATSIGNHEFDWGVSAIYENKQVANFPFLGANIYEKATNSRSDLGEPYTMIDKNGVKIGIIGTIGEKQTNSILASAVADYKFMPQTAIVNQAADELRAQGADVIVLLTHETFVDYESNSDFKKLLCVDGTCSTSKVDVIFSAHQHAYHNTVVNGVPILQARSNGKAIAHVSLNYNKTTDTVSIDGNEILDSLTTLGLSEDQEMKNLYQYYLDNVIDEVKNEVVGNQVGNFNRYADENANGLVPISQFVANSMKECGIKNYDAPIALHNFAGIRADLKPTDGKITIGDLYKVFPFDNEIIIMTVTGSQLKTIMRNHFNDTYHSPYAGVSSNGYTLENGTSVVNTNQYRIITINYLSENSSYYPSLSTEQTGMFMRDIVANKYRTEGTIYVTNYM